MTALTIVDRSVSASSNSGGSGASQFFNIWKTNPSLSQNGLVLAIQIGDTTTAPTIVDDQSNAWSAGPTIVDATHGTQIRSYFKLNAAVGTRHIQLDFGTARPSFNSAVVLEVAGLALTGSSTNAAGANTTSPISAGSFTPASVGDFIFQFMTDASAWQANGITGFTKGSGFTKVTANRLDGIFSQWRTAPGGAINPTITIGGSADTFLSLAFSLPADATKGTLRTGTYVQGVHFFAIPATDGRNPFVLDVPASGNAIAVAWIGAVSKITGITDNKGNPAYTQAGTPVLGSGQSQIFYVQPATTDDELILTVTLDTPQTDGSTIAVWDVANAGAFDTEAKTTGLQTVAGNVTGAPLITPAQGGGVVLALISIESHCVSGMVSPGIFDTYVEDAMDGGGSQLSEDNGWGTLYPVDASQISVGWTIQHNTLGVNNWGAKAISFLPAAAGFPPLPESALMHDRLNTLLRM